MKKILITIMTLMLASKILSAQESGFRLTTAAVGMSMDYTEYISNNEPYSAEYSDFTQMVGGELILDYVKVLENNNYSELGLNMMLLVGETDYTGASCYPSLGYCDEFGSLHEQTNNMILEVAVKYEYSYVYETGLEFKYGVGLGYRKWIRELNRSMIETYSWFSIRPKMALTYQSNIFSIGAKIEYQYGLYPEMILDLYPSTYVTLALGAANITKLSFPIKYKISETIDIYGEYVYEVQIIEESNIVEGWREPRSEANNQYLKFGTIYKF
jgi:hypothetical protein